ncbi:hypothetical protein C8J56DRAFT_891200 [Mycena floridula]|nr:hypothetical protein C8J56DRAFT_891200 [Mycena floridula]
MPRPLVEFTESSGQGSGAPPGSRVEDAACLRSPAAFPTRDLRLTVIRPFRNLRFLSGQVLYDKYKQVLRGPIRIRKHVTGFSYAELEIYHWPAEDQASWEIIGGQFDLQRFTFERQYWGAIPSLMDGRQCTDLAFRRESVDICRIFRAIAVQYFRLRTYSESKTQRSVTDLPKEVGIARVERSVRMGRHGSWDAEGGRGRPRRERRLE